MEHIEKYIDKKLVKDFRKDLEKIRKSLFKIEIDLNNTQFGVGGNTFRAFTGYKNRPSETYRSWAKKYTEYLFKKSEKINIRNKQDFDKWHGKLFKSISLHWKSNEKKGLSIAHTYKLVDLYFKYLSKININNLKLSKAIVKYGNCALDSQILMKINDCYSNCLPISKPSMKDIKNTKTYDFCQFLIEGFATKANGSNLEFDHWAWRKK